MRVERMASLGKLAAVVAHEINNPLASVVTYSKVLLRRYANRPDQTEESRESLEILEAIASESARCGEIVSNLLLFARRTGIAHGADQRQRADRPVALSPQAQDGPRPGQGRPRPLRRACPLIMCDPAQIEQALLALCINAVEAMPDGGTLTVRTAPARRRRRRDRGRGHRRRHARGGARATSSSRSSRPRARVRERGSASGSRWCTASSSDTVARSRSRASRGGGPVSP